MTEPDESPAPKGNTVAQGIAWTAVSKGVAFVGSAAVGIALTRMLDPERIGVLTLALVCAGVVEATSSVGLSRQLVQRDEIDQPYISTAFWGDFAFGLLGALGLAGAAPLLSAYYDADLTWLLIALSSAIPLTGLVKTQRNLAFRNMQFGIVARAELRASIASSAVAVVALVMGAGIWAIIVRELSRRAFITAALWWALDWRPSWVFSSHAFRESFGFGSRLLGVEILRQLSASADQLLVGRVFGTAHVGIYSRGQSLVLMPLQQVTSVVSTVLFPKFSRISESAELARAYVQAVGGVLVFFVPLLVAMVLLAEDAVVLVLGEQWRESSVFLRVLAPTVIWKSVSELLRSVYNSRGRTDLTLRTTIANQVLLLGGVGLGAFGGLLGVAIGHLIGSALGTLVEQAVAHRLVGMRWRALFRTVGQLLVPGLVSSFTGGLLMAYLDLGWLRLLVVGAVVFSTFALTCSVLRVPAWNRVIGAVRPLLSRR